MIITKKLLKEIEKYTPLNGKISTKLVKHCIKETTISLRQSITCQKCKFDIRGPASLICKKHVTRPHDEKYNRHPKIARNDYSFGCNLFENLCSG